MNITKVKITVPSAGREGMDDDGGADNRLWRTGNVLFLELSVVTQVRTLQ